jgi:hypothetical protein
VPVRFVKVMIFTVPFARVSWVTVDCIEARPGMLAL